jgi:hypothetical protein
MGFMSIVPALKAEIADVEADIRANPDPRVRKLQRLRETLAEYEPAPVDRQAMLASLPRTNGNGSISPAEPLAAAPSAMSKAARIKLHIAKILTEKGSVHRKDLLDSLLAAKIMGNEADPMQALAIFLSSQREIFQSDGSGHFSLRKGAVVALAR